MMNVDEYKLPLKKVIEEFELEKIYETDDLDSVMITNTDVNRPGLQMVGFFDYFDNNRIQIMGKVEFTYLEQFHADERAEKIEKLMSQHIPALIVTRGLQIFPEMIELAEKYKGKVMFYKVNADKEKDLCKHFGVQALPTLFFIPVGGQPIVAVGATPEK